MFWFLPTNNSHPTLDGQLHASAPVPNPQLGGRLTDMAANTSKVCTSERRIVEMSIARVHDMKLSGNKFPVSQQLTRASGSPPTPDLPTIHVVQEVMAVLRRNAKPYRLKYGLAPGVTYADHGRDLLARLTKENALCSTKGLVYNRQNIFAHVTPRELANGTVRRVNILNLAETNLPVMAPEELSGITLGPLSKDVTGGYITSFQEKNAQVHQQGNYVDPDNYHQMASQVRTCF